MANTKVSVTALIPARRNSQRVSNKNLRLLNGKPLIYWSIQAALTSKSVDRVIISTDCKDIANCAIELGAEVPFIRPANLASNDASTDDVMLHAIEALSLNEDDILLLLQPTSPLRTSEHIDEAVELLSDNLSLQGCVSVCECEHSPLWANTLPDDASMNSFLNEDLITRRSQDLPTYYRLNGAMYCYRVSLIKYAKKRAYTDRVKAFVMPQEASVDIDTELDFYWAEFLMQQHGSRG